MGLANIKYTVEKYYGAVEWEVKGMAFILSVMIKMNKIYKFRKVDIEV